MEKFVAKAQETNGHVVDVNSELPMAFSRCWSRKLTGQGLFSEKILGVLLLLQLLPCNKEMHPLPTVFFNASIPPSSWSIAYVHRVLLHRSSFWPHHWCHGGRQQHLCSQRVQWGALRLQCPFSGFCLYQMVETVGICPGHLESWCSMGMDNC